MSDFKFNCPTCGQHLAAGDDAAGQTINCPSCQTEITMPPLTETILRISPKAKNEESFPGGGSDSSSDRFCVNCGKPVPPAAAYCGACGSATGRTGTGKTASPPPANSHALAENTAGVLCYAGFWVSGLIFLLIDKRPFVRFHAAQSIVAFVGLMVLRYIFSFFLGFLFSILWHPAHIKPPTPGVPFNPPNVFYQPPDMTWLHGLIFIQSGLWLVVLIVWIVCMLNAARGQYYYLPIAGNIAENIAK